MTLSLTTTNVNDVLYVSIAAQGGSKTVSQITSNPSLTWTKRASLAFSSDSDLETWYAIWNSNGTISISISLTGNTNAAAVAFGVSGANTASPFDSGAPKFANGHGNSASKTISTSNPKDFVIGAVGVKNAPTLAPAADFTLLKTQTNGGHRLVLE